MSAPPYLAHFGLSEAPFSIAPNPRFLYMSAGHREGLAHLVYGLNADGGFVLLTGEVGTGKTTLCRCLLEQIPEGTDVAFIVNPRLTERDLLATIAEELGFPSRDDDSIKRLTDSINSGLLERNAQGRNTLLIIDEAQNLTPAVLEQLRLLTNLETHERKLLRFILLGQPELRDLLRSHELRQLDQRITARYHLGPLQRAETDAFLRHRLRLAGGRSDVFRSGARALIHRLAAGVPRLINVIADRALLAAWVEESHYVSSRMVGLAAREVLDSVPTLTRRRLPLAAALATTAMLAAGAFAAVQMYGDSDASVTIGETEEPRAQKAVPSVPTAPAMVPGPVTTTEPVVANRVSAPRLSTPAQRHPQPEDRRVALARIRALWPTSAATETAVCDQQIRSGLACVRLRGSWRSLAEFNRPAVLELRGTDQRTSWLAVSELTPQQVRILDADGTALLPKSALDALWTGQFLAFWDTHGLPVSMVQGMSGRAISALRARLADTGYSTGTLGNVFDASLADAVSRFQQDQGLDADGIVGPVTLVRLAEQERRAAPRLTQPTDSAGG